MRPLVSFQLEHLRKGFTANIAFEGPFFCVDRSNMVVEMVSRIKLSITVIAKETFAFISTSKMISNVTFVCKFSLTYIALIPFLSLKIHTFHNMLHILQVGSPSPPHVRRISDSQSRADLLKELLAGLHTSGDYILWPRASGLVVLIIEVSHLALGKLQLATVDIKPEPHVLRPLCWDGETALVTARGHTSLLLVSVRVLEADVLQSLLPLVILIFLFILSRPGVHCPWTTDGGDDYRTSLAGGNLYMSTKTPTLHLQIL